MRRLIMVKQSLLGRLPNASVDPILAPSRLWPSPKPVTDYDGFSVGTVDDGDTSGQAARPIRSRAANASKPSVETSGATGQKSIDQEDEVLKRKLTICRDCK
ncbi:MULTISPECIES: hypothetical protein [unclassified Bradyrhizobium]